jgi:sortase A
MDKGGVAAEPGREAPWRVALRTVGELLITLGLLLFLFCAYQLFYTNVVADRAMTSEVSDLRRSWAQTATPTPRSLSGAAAPFDTADTAGREGSAFAILHIPRIGATAIPVIEGTGLDVLGRGVGHYTGSAMPGQVGNFAVAGHRKTHGEPFRHLDAVRAGDAVVVETADTWYTYQVDRDPYIVDPTDIGVVDPVPGKPRATPTEKLLTLTTCNPWWASTQRMIVVGHLVGRQPRSAGEPSALQVDERKFQ